MDKINILIPKCDPELEKILATIVSDIANDDNIEAIKNILKEHINDFEFVHKQISHCEKISDKISENDTSFKCGYYIKQYKNFFLKTCDIHKYLHNNLDHEFIHKNELNNQQHQIYLEYNYYINLIYPRIYSIFLWKLSNK